VALREFSCIDCEKKFVEGKWSTADGHVHRVESKKYFVPTEGLSVTYASERRTSDGMNISVIPAKDLSFQRGTYITDDPEKQCFLDKYSGCCTPEVWEENHIPLKERQEQAKRKMEVVSSDLANSNAELERIKKQIAEANAELEAKKAEK
jgi:hypothetical protein